MRPRLVGTSPRRRVYTLAGRETGADTKMTTSAQTAIDGAKLSAFVGRMLGDLGALTNAALVHVGDQLGFYKAMTKSGPTNSVALAEQTGTSERPVVRELCRRRQPRPIPLTYDKSAEKFSLCPREPGFHGGLL